MCGGSDGGNGGDVGVSVSTADTQGGSLGDLHGGWDVAGQTAGNVGVPDYGDFGYGGAEATTGLSAAAQGELAGDKTGKFISKLVMNALVPGLGTGFGWIVDQARAAGQLPGNVADMDAGPQAGPGGAWDDPYLKNYLAQMTGQPYQQSADNVLSGMYGMIPPYGGPGQIAQPNFTTASPPQYQYPAFAPLAYMRPQAGPNQQSSGSRPLLGTQNALIRNKFV